ncbi:MAG: hypothetical protein K0S34_349 [Bacillales bacterium]|nr:hypothetical protein [Bacillales bacterium]
MSIKQHIINKKLNSITPQELLNLANQNNFQISTAQAVQLAGLLHGKNINIFDSSARINLLKQVAKITNTSTAQKVNEMFMEFMK